MNVEITNGVPKSNKHSNLREECQQIQRRGWSVNLKHTFREGNKQLIFFWQTFPDGQVKDWQNPPRGLSLIMQQDSMGIRCPRAVVHCNL